MSPRSARLSLVFSCLGHSYMHLFTAFYFVIVLQLEREWGLPYHQVLELWTLGALLVGLGALPAGWLGDRWSAPGMMVVMFLGMGAAAIFCGTTSNPDALLIGLAGIGLFASIYHPVGIAWVVRNAMARGKALGINGVFGNVGVAGAGLVTGGLIDLFGWQAAFIVPGAVSMLTGLALLFYLYNGAISDSKIDRKPEPAPSRSHMLRVFGLLILTMTCMGLIFQAMQTALPKVFSLRLGEFIQGSAFGVGALVATVYTIAGVMQVVGGHLADRYSLKWIYAAGFALQAPMLLLIAQATGLPLLVAAIMAVLCNAGILPAENMLIARYTPSHHRGLAYGVKFVLAFGIAPLAVLLVSHVVEITGEFVWLYLIMAGLSILALSAALLLPVFSAPQLATATTE